MRPAVVWCRYYARTSARVNKEMRLSYDSTERPRSQRAVDSIIVYANSRGILRLGMPVPHGERPPRYVVSLSATDKDAVSWEPETLPGEKADYMLINVYNRNDSPAYAVLSLRS